MRPTVGLRRRPGRPFFGVWRSGLVVHPSRVIPGEREFLSLVGPGEAEFEEAFADFGQGVGFDQDVAALGAQDDLGQDGVGGQRARGDT